MKTNLDDNKIVQKSIDTGRVEFCKSIARNYLHKITLPIRSVAHRETLVNHFHRKTYNRHHPEFSLSDPSTFPSGIQVGNQLKFANLQIDEDRAK
ncbi:MAG: hypothetical protein GX455_15710 [Phycisphaerae bacterium]|nr:hypothetical protein [Phycisphaerae bacterium]